MVLCVLLPAFNEEIRIGGLIEKIMLFVPNVVVVDDGSLDSTAESATNKKAYVIKHPKRFGKGSALRSGFEYVLEKNFDAVITMDSDGQHDPYEIQKFIKCAKCSSSDIIIGNRMLEKRVMPYIRRLTNKIMSIILSKLIRQLVPDTQCGFRLIKKEVLQKITLTSKNFEIESEVLLRASQNNFKIESIPIKTIYSGKKSYINPILDTIRFIVLLVKIITGQLVRYIKKFFNGEI
ncbi:MAG: glycosyltransferase family 2 protein [Candidatus Omnitrophica bacterium]|nr:glycosyltransferase family 2 protein [Candidatus Omnitrophota bacterium]